MKTLRSVVVLALAGFAGSCVAAEGPEIWKAHCVRCHGEDGKAQTAMGRKLKIRDFTDAVVQAAMKDDEMARSIRDGRKSESGATLMPAAKVSDEEIATLLKVVRGFKQ